uniref:Uncharacterized protein n=1 Tax=Tetraselmis sp. GSL018 TaxID=582737 RepID=A0A061QW11_9CHLO
MEDHRERCGMGGLWGPPWLTLKALHQEVAHDGVGRYRRPKVSVAKHCDRVRAELEQGLCHLHVDPLGFSLAKGCLCGAGHEASAVPHAHQAQELKDAGVEPIPELCCELL